MNDEVKLDMRKICFDENFDVSDLESISIDEKEILRSVFDD